MSAHTYIDAIYTAHDYYAAARHKHFYAILSSTGSTRNLCVRTIRKILEFLAAKTLEPEFQ